LGWLVFFAAGHLMAGVYALFDHSPDAVPAWVFWLIAAGLAVLALLRALWLLPQRRWLEVTLTGFVLSHRGRERHFRDGDVVGLWRGPPRPLLTARQVRVVVELLRGGKVQRLVCTYIVPLLQADPLQAFWQRLAVHVARRTSLQGSGWSIDAAGLHHGRGR